MVNRRIPEVFPQLETERLHLRPLSRADAADVYRNFSDPQVVGYVMEPLSSIEAADEMVEELIGLFEVGKGIFWAITLLEDGRFIGTCSYEKVSAKGRGEIGFDLGVKWWGQGLMREALSAVIAYGFKELGLKEVEAITSVQNKRSIRLLKRLGFHLSGEKVDEYRFSLKRES